MKWLLTLAAVFALPADAAPHTLNLPGIIQRHDSTCWAAVSAMASRAFTVPCQYRRPTQSDVLYSKNIGTHDLPRKCPRRCRRDALPSCDGPDPIETGKTNCGPDAILCDIPRETWLLGLSSRKVGNLAIGNTRELKADRILHEIKDRKAPVVISWEYLNPASLSAADRLLRTGSVAEAAALLNSTRGAGRHFLIIIGYDDETNEVLVWDPWPAKSVNELPEGHSRLKWIPYESYRNPKVDNGAPVNAFHDADEFAMCRCAPEALESIATLTTTAVQVRDPVNITLQVDFNFGHDVPELVQERENALRGRVVRDADGDRIGGRLDSEPGIPTVTIMSRTLLDTRERPEILLESRTAALVVPVKRHGELVDSFLLVNSTTGWREGGYSNNEIARRIMEFRAARSGEGRFYLVAIPEYGKFYVARGFTTDAELVPLDGDVRRPFAPASQVLRDAVTQIELIAHLNSVTPD
jgi:hypothetical protein